MRLTCAVGGEGERPAVLPHGKHHRVPRQRHEVSFLPFLCFVYFQMSQ